jgi:hypothetical protein
MNIPNVGAGITVPAAERAGRYGDRVVPTALTYRGKNYTASETISETMPSEQRRTAHFGQMSEALRALGAGVDDDVTPRPA